MKRRVFIKSFRVIPLLFLTPFLVGTKKKNSKYQDYQSGNTIEIDGWTYANSEL